MSYPRAAPEPSHGTTTRQSTKVHPAPNKNTMSRRQHQIHRDQRPPTSMLAPLQRGRVGIAMEIGRCEGRASDDPHVILAGGGG